MSISFHNDERYLQGLAPFFNLVTTSLNKSTNRKATYIGKAEKPDDITQKQHADLKFPFSIEYKEKSLRLHPLNGEIEG